MGGQSAASAWLTFEISMRSVWLIKIALIFDGELQNFTSPKNYYERPKNTEAAKFFGGVNFIKTRKNNNQLETKLGTLDYDGNNIHELEDDNIITIRPENIKLT